MGEPNDTDREGRAIVSLLADAMKETSMKRVLYVVFGILVTPVAIVIVPFVGAAICFYAIGRGVCEGFDQPSNDGKYGRGPS